MIFCVKIQFFLKVLVHFKKTLYICSPCPDGEIGRHATLRGWCRLRCASSSLVLGTKKERMQRILSFFVPVAPLVYPLLGPPQWGGGGTTLLSFRLLRKPDPCRSSDDDTKLCLVNFPLRFDLGKLVLWICQIIRRLAFLPFPKSDRHFTLTMPTDAFNLDSCFGT